MTAVAGILCNDGVVIGADSSVTLAIGRQPTIEQKTEKIAIAHEKVIVAGTGQVGMGQRFNEIVVAAWHGDSLKKLKRPMEVAKLLATEAIRDFQSTGASVEEYGAIVAFPFGNTLQLCEFLTPRFQPELKTENLWYASMGSAQHITDGFLGFIRNVFWGDSPPNVQEAVFAMTWMLDHAVEVNPGGVNDPVRIATLQDNGSGKLRARLLDDSELDEHRALVETAKNTLRSVPAGLRPGDETADLPTPPVNS